MVFSWFMDQVNCSTESFREKFTFQPLEEVFYPGQGGNKSRAFLGNTTHEVGKQPVGQSITDHHALNCMVAQLIHNNAILTHV